MRETKNYKQTARACYLGFVTQAISANYTPLLFLTFLNTYGITLDKLALIPMTFYLTQLVIDLVASKYADKIGYRRCVVGSQLLSGLGLLAMTVLPEMLFPYHFVGIVVSVILYAIGSGLIEVLVSPIVEACPFEHKEAMMSLLHSFYCWGALAVVFGSTIFFAIFGTQHWKILTIFWALIPLYNAINFMNCPIKRLNADDENQNIVQLLKLPIFWLVIILMVCSGAAEATMAQWASAFTESALNVSKTVGDLAGPGLFALLMGLSRALYGKYADRLDLTGTMLVCGYICFACYLIASLTTSSLLGLVGCAFCGFSVGIMWPGSISIASKKCAGGTAMFAILALAGDFGATVSPTMVGWLAEICGGNLKIGLLAASIFPIILILMLVRIRRHNKKQLFFELTVNQVVER